MWTVSTSIVASESALAVSFRSVFREPVDGDRRDVGRAVDAVLLVEPGDIGGQDRSVHHDRDRLAVAEYVAVVERIEIERLRYAPPASQ